MSRYCYLEPGDCVKGEGGASGVVVGKHGGQVSVVTEEGVRQEVEDLGGVQVVRGVDPPGVVLAKLWGKDETAVVENAKREAALAAESLKKVEKCVLRVRSTHSYLQVTGKALSAVPGIRSASVLQLSFEGRTTTIHTPSGYLTPPRPIPYSFLAVGCALVVCLVLLVARPPTTLHRFFARLTLIVYCTTYLCLSSAASVYNKYAETARDLTLLLNCGTPQHFVFHPDGRIALATHPTWELRTDPSTHSIVAARDRVGDPFDLIPIA